MNFDWQTEEEREDLWEQEQEAETSAGRRSRRRRWYVLAAVVALLLVAGYLVRREAQQRVDEATANVEGDVISSHTLGLQAAEAGDGELFVTILSGREPAWTEAQKALLEAGLLYDRAAVPFGLQPAGEPEVAGVTFSPDLRAAELQMTQNYTAGAPSGAERVTLQRTLVYREGQQRWLLSPAEADFWGSWDSVTQGPLTVDYPMRDEDVALRLAADLTQMLTDMCETMEELDCAPGWWLRLRLEKDPESLLALTEPEAGAPAGTELSLPAPSLVGLPAGEAAYQALFRGYARQLAAAAIGDLVGWECCGNGALFYQALLRGQLGEFGLRDPSTSPADYLYLVDEGVGDGELFTAVRRYWNASEPAPPAEEAPLVVRAFMEFLREEGLALPVVEMQRSIAGARSLVEWVEPAGRDANFESRLASGFEAFARRRMEEASAQAATPAGLPAPQDLLLACGDGERLDLYRYETASGDWSMEAELDADYVQMVADGPEGAVAVLAFAERNGELVIRNLLWRAGADSVQVAGTGVQGSDRVWLPLAFGPTGELAAMIYALPVNESEPSVALLDLASCAAGECSYEQLPGLPVWSPSGAHALALGVFDGDVDLYLRVESDGSWEEVGRGLSPFWLDDQTYAYLPQTEQVTLGSLWAARIGNEPQPLVAAEDLAAAMPAELSGRRPAISWAMAHPRNENQLLVAARGQGRSGQLLFSVERPDQGTPWLEAPLTVTFVEQFEEAANVDWFSSWFGAQGVVSPNGRWLLLVGTPDAGGDGFWLYDLQNRVSVLHSRSATVGDGFLATIHDWSADGQWLARPAPGLIDLLAPAYQIDGRPYRQLIVHDFEACIRPLWVEGE